MARRQVATGSGEHVLVGHQHRRVERLRSGHAAGERQRQAVARVTRQKQARTGPPTATARWLERHTLDDVITPGGACPGNGTLSAEERKTQSICLKREAKSKMNAVLPFRVAL
eukprot:1755917-Prymnesium_polylepis.1